MTAFSGVLAVFDKPTADGRILAAPAGPWGTTHKPDEIPTRWPLVLLAPGPAQPITRHVPDDGAHTIGFIDTLTVDGNLLRYSGQLDPTIKPGLAEAIQAGDVVGTLDVEIIDAEETDDGLVVRSWAVQGAFLSPASQKVWPEVSLTIDGQEIA